jgi:hypothetical protein
VALSALAVALLAWIAKRRRHEALDDGRTTRE